MKVCYNTYCPFSPGKPHECDCAEMCERFTDGPVAVTTSDCTETTEQIYGNRCASQESMS